MNGNFVKVKCKDCSNELIVFVKATTTVKCDACGATITKPSGGNAKIFGEKTDLE